ncbi:unnamed protein product [Closterium sp. Yama58-4]|nr:unnamed protein product [Closterium sp. Yama58-4]
MARQGTDGPCTGLRSEFALVVTGLENVISAILAQFESGIESDASDIQSPPSAPSPHPWAGDGPCSGLRDEFSLVVTRLEEAITAILAQFESGIESDASDIPATATIHGLTRYVVNYVILLYEYRDSLERLFKRGDAAAAGKIHKLVVSNKKGGGGGGRDGSGRDGGRGEGGLDTPGESSGSEMSGSGEEGSGTEGSENESEEEDEEEARRREQARREARKGFRGAGVPEYAGLGRKVVWQLAVLEKNLQGKARQYRDPAQGEVFLLNNIHYMARKVKESDMRVVVGDDWVRRQVALVRQHASEYLRFCFSRLSYTLRIDPSTQLHKSTLKEKFKAFNILLEEIHRDQTRWLVNPGPLRDELRLAVKQRVLAPYTDFYLAYKHVMEASRHPGKYLRHDPVEFRLDSLPPSPYPALLVFWHPPQQRSGRAGKRMGRGEAADGGLRRQQQERAIADVMGTGELRAAVVDVARALIAADANDFAAAERAQQRRLAADMARAIMAAELAAARVSEGERAERAFRSLWFDFPSAQPRDLSALAGAIRNQVDLIPSTGSSSATSSGTTSSSSAPSFPITSRFLSGLSYVATSAHKAQLGRSSTAASNSAPAAAAATAGEGGREGPRGAAGVGEGDAGVGEEEQGAAGRQLAAAAAQIAASFLVKLPANCFKLPGDAGVKAFAAALSSFHLDPPELPAPAAEPSAEPGSNEARALGNGASDASEEGAAAPEANGSSTNGTTAASGGAASADDAERETNDDADSDVSSLFHARLSSFMLASPLSCSPLPFHARLSSFMLASPLSCSPLLFHARLSSFMLASPLSCSPLLFHARLSSFMLASPLSCSPLLFHARLSSFMLASPLSCSPLLFHARLSSFMLSSFSSPHPPPPALTATATSLALLSYLISHISASSSHNSYAAKGREARGGIGGGRVPGSVGGSEEKLVRRKVWAAVNAFCPGLGDLRVLLFWIQSAASSAPSPAVARTVGDSAIKSGLCRALVAAHSSLASPKPRPATTQPPTGLHVAPPATSQFPTAWQWLDTALLFLAASSPEVRTFVSKALPSRACFPFPLPLPNQPPSAEPGGLAPALPGSVAEADWVWPLLLDPNRTQAEQPLAWLLDSLAVTMDGVLTAKGDGGLETMGNKNGFGFTLDVATSASRTLALLLSILLVSSHLAPPRSATSAPPILPKGGQLAAAAVQAEVGCGGGASAGRGKCD